MPRFPAAVAALLLALAPAAAQPAPTAESVAASLARFKAERADAAKWVTDAELAAADRFAERAKQAADDGDFPAADRLARDARWAVPVRPADMPPHVVRVIGLGRLRHADRVNAVAYSPDGTKLASASRDGTVRVWDLGNGKELLAYRGHAERDAAKAEDTNVLRAAGVAFSPDGKKVASCGGSDAHVWDASTGKREAVLTGHTAQVRAVAWGTDGTTVVTGSDDKTVIVWDLAAAKPAFTSPPQPQRVEAVAVAAGGKQIASVNAAGELTVYAPATEKKLLLAVPVTTGGEIGCGVAYAGAAGIATAGGDAKAKLTAPPAGDGATQGAGATIREYRGHTDKVNALAADARLIATGSRDRTVRVWDVGTGKTLWTFQGHLGAVTAVALRPDGKEVASGGEDGAVKLWPLTTADEHRAATDAADPLWTVAVSPDGSKFAAAGADRKIRLYDASGKPLSALPGHTGAVTAVAFLGADRLASVGGDKLVKLWDLGTGKADDLKGHEGAVLAVAADPAGTLVVSGSVDRSVRGWDPKTGKERWAWPGKSAVCAVAVAKDGKRVAVGTADGALTMLGVGGDKPKVEATVSAHLAGTAAVAFSPDGARLATCGGDGAVRLWGVPADGGPPAAQLKLEPAAKDPEGAPVVTVAFSADGRFLAAGGKDALVRLWDARTGAEVKALRGHADWVTAAAFRPDGAAVVSVGADKAVRVWDLARRDAVASGHSLEVRAVAVSRDGARIATGSLDHTVKVWDVASGKEVATLAGATDAVNGVGFDDAGRVFAVSADGGVRTWAAPDWAEAVFARTARDAFGLAVAPDGKAAAVVWVKPADKLTTFDVLRPGGDAAQVTEKGRAITSAALAADMALGVTGGEDGVVRVWDLAARDRDGGDWPLFKESVADLGLTPDKKTLVAIDKNGTVKVADVAAREVRATVAAAPDGVNGVVVAPAGGRFVTLSADGDVKLWDLAGKELRGWRLPTPAVAAAFAPGGKRLVTGNKDGTAYVLELP